MFKKFQKKEIAVISALAVISILASIFGGYWLFSRFDEAQAQQSLASTWSAIESYTRDNPTDRFLVGALDSGRKTVARGTYNDSLGFLGPMSLEIVETDGTVHCTNTFDLSQAWNVSLLGMESVGTETYVFLTQINNSGNTPTTMDFGNGVVITDSFVSNSSSANDYYSHVIKFDETCTAIGSQPFGVETQTVQGNNDHNFTVNSRPFYNDNNICLGGHFYNGSQYRAHIGCYDRTTFAPSIDLYIPGDFIFRAAAIDDNNDIYFTTLNADPNESITINNTISTNSDTYSSVERRAIIKYDPTNDAVVWGFDDDTGNYFDLEANNGQLVVVGRCQDLNSSGVCESSLPGFPTNFDIATDPDYRSFVAELNPATGAVIWAKQINELHFDTNEIYFDGADNRLLILNTAASAYGDIQFDGQVLVASPATGSSIMDIDVAAGGVLVDYIYTAEATNLFQNITLNPLDNTIVQGSFTTPGFTLNDITVPADSYFWLESEPLPGRILDCRLPSDSMDPLSTPVKVSPIIEPNYAKVGNDQFGLAKDSAGNIYTVNGPSRTLYGDGLGGPSNSQIALYQQPLSFNTVTPADAINSPSTPGSITSTTVTGGFTGRPMDIETVSFNGTTSIFIYALRPASGAVTSLVVDSDLNGDLVGFIVEVDPGTGAGTLYADNLPVGGYGKMFGDISIDNGGNVFIDDVRSSYTPTNDYTYIPRVDNSGTVNATFAQPTLNTFYDIATDDAGNAYSLLGSGNPAVLTKTGVYQIDPAGNVTTVSTTFPVPADGGDIEVADADDTYEMDLTGTDYIYYSSGFGAGSTSPAMVRINPDGSTTVSNGESVDEDFTSANTGYMDKMILDLDNQIIYYKNGARSVNDPDQTIGKIYCPTQDQVDTPPASNPGPDPTPGDPQGPGANGSPEGFGGGAVYDADVVLTKTSSAGTNAVNTGDTVVYTISVANTGTVAETNLVINDFIDADLTFSGTPTCLGDITNCTYDAGTSLLSWTIPQLNAGETITFNYSAVVN